MACHHNFDIKTNKKNNKKLLNPLETNKNTTFFFNVYLNLGFNWHIMGSPIYQKITI
jgi:hypothetical protein